MVNYGDIAAPNQSSFESQAYWESLGQDITQAIGGDKQAAEQAAGSAASGLLSHLASMLGEQEVTQYDPEFQDTQVPTTPSTPTTTTTIAVPSTVAGIPTAYIVGGVAVLAVGYFLGKR